MAVKKKVAKKATKKKAAKQTKEVTVRKSTKAMAVTDSSLPDDLQGAFDPTLMGATVDKEDIVISKAWLTQSMSDCVTDDKCDAEAGEYRNSRTLELIAEKGETFEGIVIDNYKTWQCFEEDENGEMEYTETLNYYEHSNLKFDSVNPETGRAIHRDLVLGYFILAMDEVMKGDAFPLILDFKRTSRATGKDLATSIAQLASKNIPSYAKVYNFGSEQKTTTKNGKEYRYYVKTVDEGRWINKEELEVIITWAKELAKKKAEGKVHVDDSDISSNSNEDIVDAEVVNNGKKQRF